MQLDQSPWQPAEDLALYTEALASEALFSDPDSLAQMTAFQEVDPLKFGLMTSYGLGVGVIPLEAAQAWEHTGGPRAMRR